ncbi:RNA polymerase sigma factor [Catellatospora sp. NPDC049609]|uniref:RNA polymerase sigma factor n=1 Tax=Catellatospora sp. NPDC049609 TaxID=3155505 RepID=UPI00341B5F0F
MIRADTGPGEVSPTHIDQHAAPPAMSVEEFFLAHADRLENLARWFGATSDADAEDAVSLTMIDMLKPGRWETIRNPVWYANRAVITHTIRRRREQQRTSPLTDELEPYADDPALLEWEASQWIEQMLKQLPPKQREVVECHLLGGETYKDMQARTGRREAALRRSQSDALTTLRAIGLSDGEIMPAVTVATKREEMR